MARHGALASGGAAKTPAPKNGVAASSSPSSQERKPPPAATPATTIGMSAVMVTVSASGKAGATHTVTAGAGDATGSSKAADAAKALQFGSFLEDGSQRYPHDRQANKSLRRRRDRETPSAAAQTKTRKRPRGFPECGCWSGCTKCLGPGLSSRQLGIRYIAQHRFAALLFEGELVMARLDSTSAPRRGKILKRRRADSDGRHCYKVEFPPSDDENGDDSEERIVRNMLPRSHLERIGKAPQMPLQLRSDLAVQSGLCIAGANEGTYRDNAMLRAIKQQEASRARDAEVLARRAAAKVRCDWVAKSRYSAQLLTFNAAVMLPRQAKKEAASSSSASVSPSAAELRTSAPPA